MTECAFRNCINHGSKRIKLETPFPEVTFHLFPKNSLLREKWVKQMNQEDWRPSPLSALCSLHFNKDYFITDARGVSFLKSDAIPTEFELYQGSLEMAESTAISCCAYRCNNTFSPDSTVTFHPFPLDMPDLCAQWLAAMNCSQIDGEQAVLCSEHFDEACFVYNEEAQKFLISDAVPSIFIYPDADEVNDEAAPQEDSNAEMGEFLEMPSGQEPDMSIIKYEISEENLDLIRRHDEVVGELMLETQRLLDLKSKRLKLEKRKKDLEVLLRATLNNTTIDRKLIRNCKLLLKDLNEQQKFIQADCMTACEPSNMPDDSQQG